MQQLAEVIWLDDLGIVRARGADAVRFLQGQLSNDLTRLSADGSLLGGYHNPQGRTIALLRLVYWDEGDVLAVLPRELAAGVAGRLSKFVLRSKVKITDESKAWRMGGLIGVTQVTVGAGTTAELPATVNAQVRADGAVFVRVGVERVLVVSPGENPAPDGGVGALPDSVVGGREIWRRLQVEDGEPQVYAATSEEFVAQMLNLDMLNAIAFDKGCYTGQEVIARAHYRGRVKRRMQRFISREPCRLSPGDSGQLADGRAFKVVLAAHLAGGRSDFLAVAPLPGAEPEGASAAPTASSVAPAGPAGAAVVAPTVAAAGALASGSAAGSPPTSAANTAVLVADPVPLPYALPD
jgi:tRNA-modifying protein YgfZ